eukprot:3848102-Pyramimonas_sp.AAC.1
MTAKLCRHLRGGLEGALLGGPAPPSFSTHSWRQRREVDEDAQQLAVHAQQLAFHEGRQGVQSKLIVRMRVMDADPVGAHVEASRVGPAMGS